MIYTSIEKLTDELAKAIIVGPGGWGSVTDAVPMDVAINAARSWASIMGVEFRA